MAAVRAPVQGVIDPCFMGPLQRHAARLGCRWVERAGWLVLELHIGPAGAGVSFPIFEDVIESADPDSVIPAAFYWLNVFSGTSHPRVYAEYWEFEEV